MQEHYLGRAALAFCPESLRCSYAKAGLTMELESMYDFLEGFVPGIDFN